ncbi:MAG TPA: 3-phosphoshikimate 1-carboxyvinyltransferase [Terriglobales bacterium]|nr:3-phosphoshikimate 1-carboxyvinyltransferase [Terriglobales bacterium]
MNPSSIKTEKSCVTIQPANNVVGSIRIPGDKSISHRYAMLSGLAQGTTKLSNFSTGADCASTLGCMVALGCTIRRNNGDIEIDGRAGDFAAPKSSLDCGNSGSTMRMLAGILAGQPFTSEMIGDASLSRRPMRRIIEPLIKMGAKIESRDGCAPLRVTGAKLNALSYHMPVPSAQVKSAVLFAGLLASGETWVEEPVKTRDHTEVALKAFGVDVVREKTRAGVRGGQKLRAIEAVVPGDISSAAFFLCAAALFPESNLVIDSLLLNPTRAVLLDVLIGMGARIPVISIEEQHGELVGSVNVQPGTLKGARIRGAQAAALIDELPVLAAIAPYTRDGVEIRDAKELRVKESDRIAAVAENLRRMGARVEEFEDGLRVPGQQQLHAADIDSKEDHRIAMAFAVAALRARGETRIFGADAARISYPEFFHVLQQITE